MNISELLTRSQGRPIEYGGHIVHGIYRRVASGGTILRLRWIDGVDQPVQGVSISVKGGHLKVAETKAKDIVLWRDTSPAEVAIACIGAGVREVGVWNCWRDEHGVMQAWIGNAGMHLLAMGPDAIRAHCNSGHAVTFRDLIFDLMFEDVPG